MSDRTISSFKEIEPTVHSTIDLWKQHKEGSAWDLLEKEILMHRVKFPILEKVAILLFKELNPEAQNLLRSKLAQAKHISCYPVIGKLLQLEPGESIESTYRLAIKHIIEGDEWYACDIIAERVFGEGTLRYFDDSYPLLLAMANHPNLWIQRSIGIGTHYATKKKLSKDNVEKLLMLMLDNGHKTQLYIKKGIGWAGKTIAKYHPDLIHRHADKIQSTKLSKWFLRKVRIGLSMAKAEPLDYE